MTIHGQFHPTPALCACRGEGWTPGTDSDVPCPHHAQSGLEGGISAEAYEDARFDLEAAKDNADYFMQKLKRAEKDATDRAVAMRQAADSIREYLSGTWDGNREGWEAIADRLEESLF